MTIVKVIMINMSIHYFNKLWQIMRVTIKGENELPRKTMVDWEDTVAFASQCLVNRHNMLAIILVWEYFITWTLTHTPNSWIPHKRRPCVYADATENQCVSVCVLQVWSAHIRLRIACIMLNGLSSVSHWSGMPFPKNLLSCDSP